MYLYLTFHNNGFCHSPLENHWVILSVCYHHLGLSRWAEKILPCHQLMPYKRIQFRGANLCEAPRNCECVSSPSIETESQKEKSQKKKMQLPCLQLPQIKGQTFRCPDKAGSSQSKPLQPLLYRWSLIKSELCLGCTFLELTYQVKVNLILTCGS